MARIAFAVELGGELGHVKACSELANPLALRGHRIAFIRSELHSLQFLRGIEAFEVFSVQSGLAPTSQTRPASYAEVLVGCGYRSAATLAPLAGAWREVLEKWKPDLVIADYAPTAMLAARALGIGRINFGSGFSIPPRLSPLPCFRFDESIPVERIVQADARARDAVNGVLERWGEKPLERLAELLECDEEFLCTFPELDHYGTRAPSGYWGPRFQVSSGARVAWPAGGGKRIFVYLKQTLPQLDAVIEWLAASRHRVAAFIPGLDEVRRAKLAGPGRQVSSEPIRLEPLLADCDLVLSHGGELSLGTLTHGIAQLVFPTHFEQYITAKRIEQMGCGLWIGAAANASHVANALGAVLTQPGFAAAARAFAKRYPAYSPREQRRRMVARIEQLVRTRGGAAPILPASPDKERQR